MPNNNSTFLIDLSVRVFIAIFCDSKDTFDKGDFYSDLLWNGFLVFYLSSETNCVNILCITIPTSAFIIMNCLN